MAPYVDTLGWIYFQTRTVRGRLPGNRTRGLASWPNDPTILDISATSATRAGHRGGDRSMTQSAPRRTPPTPPLPPTAVAHGITLDSAPPPAVRPKESVNAIHQLVAGFSRGDAISTRRSSCAASSVPGDSHPTSSARSNAFLPDLRKEARDVADLQAACKPPTSPCLHLSIGSSVNEAFAALPCRKAIRTTT